MLRPEANIDGPAAKSGLERIPWRERIPARSTYDLLRRVAEHQPAAPALTFLSTAEDDASPLTVSARELIDNVTRAANLFTRLGATRADAVSILLPFVPETHYALWGAAASSIAMPINVLLRAEHIVALLLAARSKVLVALGPSAAMDIWSKVTTIRGAIPGLKVLCVPAEGGLPPGEADFRELLSCESAGGLDLGTDPRPDGIAAYFHTGGTTGAPKLACHSHAGHVHAAWALTQAFQFSPGDQILNGLPPFHVAGSIIVGFAPLAAGASVLMPTPTGNRNPHVIQNFWRIVERHRATFVGGVPTTLGAVLQAPHPAGDVSFVRGFYTGGSVLPAALANRFEDKTGVPVCEIYGMTEGTSTIAVTPSCAKRRDGWIGFAVPYVQLAVARMAPDGTVEELLAPGEPGVVLYRGPNVFPGYLDSSRDAGVLLDGGWLMSGDLGVVDEAGWLRLTGRSKDLIIRGGHNIDPSVIEDAASAHPDVATCAAIGQPDGYAGEVPVLYVSPRAGASVDPVELMTFVASRVAEPAARPRSIYLVPEMPVTAVGKIFKPTLRLDAARRAIEEAASRLPMAGVTYTMSAEHNNQGSIVVRIRVSGDEDRARAFVSALRDAMLSMPIVLEMTR